MLDAPLSPAQQAGEAIRQTHSLRREAQVRQFYRAIIGRGRFSAINRLTALTLAVWAHPEGFR